jgi:hypothetical protein
MKDVLRLDIADHRTAGALAGDDDLFLLLGILARLLGRGLGRRWSRLSLQLRKGRHHGGRQKHRDPGAVQHAPPVEERA